MKRIRRVAGLVGVVAAIGVAPAFGQGGPVITFDEFGNGAFGPGVIQPDPGPGGLPAVMTYPLTFPGTVGDLRVHDPPPAGAGPVLDIIRWNGNGTLLFYSDNVDGVDAPADTPSPPTQLYANVADIDEGGVEGGIEDFFYTPLPGQPGFNPNAPGMTYHLISDVPEPGSATLLLVGGVLLGFKRIRRKLAA